MAVEMAATTEQGLTPAETRHFHMLEGRIERGLQTFREVGAALTEIRDSKLYRETHQSFESYCADRWDLGRDRAYQLIDAAEVAEVLGEEGPTNEAQARELRALLTEGGAKEVREAWKAVKATGKPVTAAVIREVAQAHMGGVVITPAPSLTEQVVDRVLSLVNLYRKWEAGKPSRKDRTTVKAAFDKLADLTG